MLKLVFISLLSIPALANADVSLQARFTSSGDVVTYRVLAGTSVVLEQPAASVPACGPAKCLGPFPLGPDGLTTSYSVQACDGIGRCATSNVVPFRVPITPGVANLGIELQVVP